MPNGESSFLSPLKRPFRRKRSKSEPESNIDSPDIDMAVLERLFTTDELPSGGNTSDWGKKDANLTPSEESSGNRRTDLAPVPTEATNPRISEARQIGDDQVPIYSQSKETGEITASVSGLSALIQRGSEDLAERGLAEIGAAKVTREENTTENFNVVNSNSPADHESQTSLKEIFSTSSVTRRPLAKLLEAHDAVDVRDLIDDLKEFAYRIGATPNR